MKLNLKALALTAGILWALALFLTGMTSLIWPGYGEAFLKMMASVYPGYHASGSIGDVIVGTLYAFLDGAIFGLVFGWLYNLLGGKRTLS
jgi:ABC-type phosphate transport system permease subunit